MPREPLDENDILFAEQAVKNIRSAENTIGGPRVSEDIGRVVQQLVTATIALQETTKTIQAAMSAILASIEGKAFGDRSDGLNFRVGKLERDSALRLRLWRLAFAMLTFVFARVGWVEFHEAWPTVMHALGFR